MQPMMHSTTGPGMNLFFIGGLHALAALAITVGLVLLVAWAIKYWSEAKLKTWGLWLFVGGVVVCLLFTGTLYSNGYGKMKNGGMRSMGMGMMMRDVDGEYGDAMDMSMSDMSMMLSGKSGDDFDAAFIEGMIPHHQGAIDMAMAAKMSAKHAEIKKMADAIISAQQREIDQMRGWQKSWGYSQ